MEITSRESAIIAWALTLMMLDPDRSQDTNVSTTELRDLSTKIMKGSTRPTV